MAHSRFIDGIVQARTVHIELRYIFLLFRWPDTSRWQFFNGVVIFIFILFVNVFLLLKILCGQLHTFKYTSKMPLSVYN